MKRHGAIIALFILATASRAFAAHDGVTETFVMEAVKSGMHEVAVGQLALTKSSNEDVKKFGRHLVDDHSRANDELKQLAAKNNIEIKAGLHPADHDVKLMSLSGMQFDRAFIADTIDGHTKTVELYERYSKEGQHADIKAFAIKTLPALKDHLTMAQTLSDKMSKGATANDSADHAIDTQYKPEPALDVRSKPEPVLDVRREGIKIERKSELKTETGTFDEGSNLEGSRDIRTDKDLPSREPRADAAPSYEQQLRNETAASPRYSTEKSIRSRESIHQPDSVEHTPAGRSATWREQPVNQSYSLIEQPMDFIDSPNY